MPRRSPAFNLCHSFTYVNSCRGMSQQESLYIVLAMGEGKL